VGSPGQLTNLACLRSAVWRKSYIFISGSVALTLVPFEMLSPDIAQIQLCSLSESQTSACPDSGMCEVSALPLLIAFCYLVFLTIHRYAALIKRKMMRTIPQKIPLIMPLANGLLL
jgi:hypothetical protein